MKKTLWLIIWSGLILFIVFGTMTLIEVKNQPKNMSEETLINETYKVR